MGMFNWVTVPEGLKCLQCGEDMGGSNNAGWQTKDCRQELTCADIPYTDCDNFYASCPKCKFWNEYQRTRANSLADFEPTNTPTSGEQRGT